MEIVYVSVSELRFNYFVPYLICYGHLSDIALIFHTSVFSTPPIYLFFTQQVSEGIECF